MPSSVRTVAPTTTDVPVIVAGPTVKSTTRGRVRTWPRYPCLVSWLCNGPHSRSKAVSYFWSRRSVRYCATTDWAVARSESAR
jgi:hypothetical protein